MSQQLYVNQTPFETRVAVLEGNQLIELLIERRANKGLVGNIYLAKVQRVLPGMQAAFLDIGLDKSAFLYVGDVLPFEAYDEIGEESEPKKRSLNPIQDLIKPGQTLLVQVVKDSIGTKGPRVSCNPSLPGHYLVHLPTSSHTGVSRKITNDEERERLKNILQAHAPENTGFIARTLSQTVPEDKLAEDCQFLTALWIKIQKRSKQLKAPSLVQAELDLVLKCARDMTNQQLDRIMIDNQETVNQVSEFVKLFDASLSDRIEYYDQADPIFSQHGIENEITRAMNRKVWLRSGGYIIIDQAEALTVIDVNTGKFVGRKSLEDTILHINLEAAKEVAYQLRLRNIGGMVIIDFIDMEGDNPREKVLHVFQDLLSKDKARCKVIKISELGLIEMTRQRKRESLEHILCETCYYCNGQGSVKSKQSIAYEIFREALETHWRETEPQITVQAHPEVVDFIRHQELESLKQLEEKLEKEIILKARGSFHQEQFDVFASHSR